MILHCRYDELVDPNALKPHPKNANKHPEDQIERLAKILNYQGWRYPIKVSRRSGFVTSGHGRILAAKHLGWTEVPVNYQDYEDEDQEHADVHSDNAIASWAELDLSLINTQMGDFDPGFDLDLLGIKDFTLDISDKEFGSGEDEVPEAPPEPVVKRGELWVLGEHRLLIDDCTVKENVERLMGGEKADMVFTDPPYGISYQSNYRKEKFEQLENDDVILSAWAPLASEASTGWVIFFCAWQRIDEWVGVGREFGKLTNILVWRKAAAMGDLTGQFAPTYELALAYNRGGKLREGNRPSAVFERNIESPSEFQHPTQKPISLIIEILSAVPGHSAYDPFLGSGSTLIACEKTNRRCFGMEIDPHYGQVIIERWQKFSGKKAVREDGVTFNSLKIE